MRMSLWEGRPTKGAVVATEALLKAPVLVGGLEASQGVSFFSNRGLDEPVETLKRRPFAFLVNWGDPAGVRGSAVPMGDSAAVVEVGLRSHLVEGADDRSRVLVVVVHRGLCRRKDHDRKTF